MKKSDLKDMPGMLPKFIEIMEYSFPYSERRPSVTYKAYLTNNDNGFTVNLFIEDSDLIGFLVYWKLSGYVFIEHFAVSRKHRNSGFGKAIISGFIEQTDAPLILEVEPPDNEISQRRIEFYNRLGFVTNPHKYVQPAYHNDSGSVDMLLMTKRLLSHDEFASVQKEIYAKVYKTNIKPQ